MGRSRTKRATTADVTGPKWLAPGIASQALDVGLWKLADLRKRGVFKIGYHYRDIAPPGAQRPTFQYHAMRCDALLSGTEGRAIAAGGGYADG